MEFMRLYPVELLYRGTLGGSDNGINKDGRIEKVREWFAIDKPNIIIESISEESGLTGTDEDDYVYRVNGYSTDPGVR